MSDIDLLRQARDELRVWLLQLHGFKPRNATEDSNRIEPLILALDMRLREVRDKCRYCSAPPEAPDHPLHRCSACIVTPGAP